MKQALLKDSASKYKRIDNILLFLLQVHECTLSKKDEKLMTAKLIESLRIIESSPETKDFEESNSDSLYTNIGSNVSGTLLFQLIEWIERFQMNPTEYYQMNCQGLTDPAERFLNHFTCRDAWAYSESYEKVAKEHPQLAEQILQTKPCPVPAELIDKTLPRTHVVIVQGALDKATEF